MTEAQYESLLKIVEDWHFAPEQRDVNARALCEALARISQSFQS